MSIIMDNNTFLAQEGLPGRSAFDNVRGKFENKVTAKPTTPMATARQSKFSAQWKNDPALSEKKLNNLFNH